MLKASALPAHGTTRSRRRSMAWTRPKLREICIGMEINGYFAGKL
jgi:coenzyme PQQ precursor peptide PqqA